MKIKFNHILLLTLSFLIFSSTAQAFWLWNPKTKEFLNPGSDVTLSPSEQLNYAMNFFDEQSYEKALEEFQKLVKTYEKSREAAEAQYYIGRCFEKLDKHYDAFQAYQKTIDKYPFTERHKEIIQRQYDLAGEMIQLQAETNEWMNVFRGTTNKITQTYEKVIENDPYGEFAGAAQYKIAEYLMSRGWYEEAEEEFQTTIDEYPNTVWAKQARFQLGLSEAKQLQESRFDKKITDEAVESLEGYIDLYPESEKADEAKAKIESLKEKEAQNEYEVAEFYHRQKNYNAAKVYYQSVINDYPKTQVAEKARQKIQELVDVQ